MNFVLEYLKYNYPTVVLLLAIVILVAITGYGSKIEKTGYIYTIAFLTFIISVLEFSEEWIDAYNLNYRLLYYKAMLIYWLYPMIALLLLFMIWDIKYKPLLIIPQLVNMIINAIDLSGTGLIYGYGKEHNYNRGPVSSIPFIVEDLYIILIGIYSLKMIGKGKKSKGVVVAFMAGTIFFSQFLLNKNMSGMYLPTVIAAVILIYYFYLAAIQYNETREELNQSQLKLERNKNNLLLAQIRPHFINSNLAVIRSLCYEDPKKAVEMIDHFSGYLRENIQQMDDMRLVPFEKEMESVDNYVYLEMQRFPDRIEVIKDFAIQDFSVPPLSIQTIVENAIRHGISMKKSKGIIRISTEEKDGNIIIKVEDDGKGFDAANTEYDGVKHVGIKNVKDRYRRILNGEVTVESEEGRGTVVTFTIPVES